MGALPTSGGIPIHVFLILSPLTSASPSTVIHDSLKPLCTALRVS